VRSRVLLICWTGLGHPWLGCPYPLDSCRFCVVCLLSKRGAEVAGFNSSTTSLLKTYLATPDGTSGMGRCFVPFRLCDFTHGLFLGCRWSWKCLAWLVVVHN
jgi:hypothetical protein